jgi:hypothetical protein
MDIKEVAEKLNDNENTNELNGVDVKELENNGIVVVFGASDDLMEFCGAIYDEIDARNGTTVYITKNGLLVNQCDEENCPYFQEILKNCKSKIIAIWGMDNISWQYITDIPHETLDIMEDGEIYCKGIVFRLEYIVE